MSVITRTSIVELAPSELSAIRKLSRTGLEEIRRIGTGKSASVLITFRKSFSQMIDPLLSMVQWEPGSGCVRGAVSVKTCLAAGGRSFMWLRNVTVCQICCTVKTFFQPGMAVQRMPCSRM